MDAFDMEPPVLQEHPLFDASSLIATPHVTFAYAQAMQKRAVIVCSNLDAWLKNAPLNVIC